MSDGQGWPARLGDMVRRTRPRAVPRNLLEQYPEAVGMVVPMGDISYRVSNMDPFELYCLAAIGRIRRPRTIFEFGTYDGGTTRWLAENVPEAEIFTIDLPKELRNDWIGSTLVTGPSGEDGLGARFRGTQYESRITQLLGDSRTYDFSPYFGRVDLVVVDGGHSYECAASDTENAIKMVSPAGTVVWDDYGWPGVVRAVDEGAQRHGITVTRLVPTELAVHDRAAAGAEPSRSV